MKTLFASTLFATLLLTSTAFALKLPEQPIKPEPEGPDVQLHQPTPQMPSGLDGLVIR